MWYKGDDLSYLLKRVNDKNHINNDVQLKRLCWDNNFYNDQTVTCQCQLKTGIKKPKTK